jgi:hypothetical protein
MANIKTLLDLRRAKSDGTFNIIFRIIDFKKVYTIHSGVSISQHVCQTILDPFELSTIKQLR